MKSRAIVEASLFMESDPVTIEDLIGKTGLGEDRVIASLKELKEFYSTEDSGLDLIIMDETYILTPKKECWEFLRNTYGKKYDEKLSKAALETLSIIAYSQPITKNEIDILRGVSSDTMVRMLTKKDLVKIVGKKDIPGKPPVYGTTGEFLKLFGLNSIKDLPDLKEEDKERFELNA